MDNTDKIEPSIEQGDGDEANMEAEATELDLVEAVAVLEGATPEGILEEPEEEEEEEEEEEKATEVVAMAAFGMAEDGEDAVSVVSPLEHEVFLHDTVEPLEQVSSPVLPPIAGHKNIECQTDIRLAGEGVSSFRPDNLQGLSPYLQPLPVIGSAPALLRGEGAGLITPSKTSGGIASVQSKSSDGSSDQPGTVTQESSKHADPSQANLYKDDSRSDLQPTDDETASTYSAMSELDGVGPPTILQYIRESTKAKKKVPPPKSAVERFPSVDPSVERGNMCPFCHTELLPVPPLSDTSSDSGRDSPAVSPTRKTPGSPMFGIKDMPGDKTPAIAAMSRFSVESPPPVLDERDDGLPEDGYLYCCEDYYWHLVNKDRMQRRDSFYIEGEVMEVKKIDVSPHAPFGSKAARKVAKDRASERVRERELERVRPTGGNLRAGAGTLFSYARQMKTINFALSSRKCLEDGWTVTNYLPPPKTPDPILYDSDTQSHPLPNLLIPWQQDAGGLLIKKYTNDTPFLTLLGDGTGTCYYPSGCPAIVITLEQPNLFTYYVLSDSDTSPKLMAVLSQRGRCVVYHDNKGLLYHSSPLEGSLFNKEGQRTKHWEWDAFTPHVHAPPFQPICFQMSNYLAMRCVSLEQQSLVFQYKRFTFRCSVGSRSKKLVNKPQPTAQYVMYMDALDQTRAKINANLRQLNDAISTVQDISKREVTTDRKKRSPRPTSEAQTRATSIAV